VIEDKQTANHHVCGGHALLCLSEEASVGSITIAVVYLIPGSAAV